MKSEFLIRRVPNAKLLTKFGVIMMILISMMVEINSYSKVTSHTANNGASHTNNHITNHLSNHSIKKSIVHHDGKTNDKKEKSHSWLPKKANVKKTSAIPLAAMKENHEKNSHVEKNKKVENEDLPTLEEINKEENNKKKHKNKKTEHNDLPTLEEINKEQDNKKENHININHSDKNNKESINKSENKKDDLQSKSLRTEEKSNKISSEKPRTTTSYKSIGTAPKSGGFFADTSKKNQSKAWEALSAFVAGIILWFVSIQLVCWNERRAVKFSNFIDWVSSDSNLVPIGKNSLNGSKLENKAYLVNGTLKVVEEPKTEIKDFDQILNSMRSNVNGHKLLFVKLCFEKWQVIGYSKTGMARKDEEGREEEEVTYEEDWMNISESSNEIFCSKLYSGVANLSDTYNLDLDKISHLVNFADYQPAQNDFSIIENIISTRTNSNPEYKIFRRGNFFYILNSPANENLTDQTFNENTHEFKENDRRLHIKYYKVDEFNTNDNQFTLGGKLEIGKNNLYDVTPFNSPIKQAEWSFYLCCFGETDEAYQVNIVAKNAMTKIEVINMYEAENKACTWILRIIGFMLHFLAYYLILYPLILLIGMIPYIGAVGATVLVIFAFIFACITFLFVIAVAWLFARPLLAFFLFGLIALLMYAAKSSRDKFGNYNQTQESEYIGAEMNDQRKMKFL